LFKPDVEILLYDLTSVYFESEAEKNEQAQRGYSRDHRPDAKYRIAEVGSLPTDGAVPAFLNGALKEVESTRAVARGTTDRRDHASAS
jgi:hypothetical protein